MQPPQHYQFRDAARAAAASDPALNRHFSRRWADPQDPSETEAFRSGPIRASHDPVHLRPRPAPSAGRGRLGGAQS